MRMIIRTGDSKTRGMSFPETLDMGKTPEKWTLAQCPGLPPCPGPPDTLCSHRPPLPHSVALSSADVTPSCLLRASLGAAAPLRPHLACPALPAVSHPDPGWH